MGDNKSNLHYLYNLFYPIGILSLVIIVLLTVKWADIPDFVKYLTFGLTLTSLILSLIAIIYMIVSQVSYSRGINVLQDASNAVSGATDKLAEVTARLASKVESIPAMIEEVGERADKRHQELLQQITTGMGEPGAPAAQKEGLSEDLVSSFVKRSSLNGVLGLYACQLAYSKKVPFKSKELWEEAGSSDDMSAYGFLVASHGFGLVDFNIKGDMWNVTEFSEMLPKDLRDVCCKKVEELVKEHPKLTDIESFLMKGLETIDKYFED